MAGKDKLIVALDVNDMRKVKTLVAELGDGAVYYKVGMELFYSVGPEVIRYLRAVNKQVFLDLKLHDIPNTVAQSMKVLTSLGVSMLNVHAAGGMAMMKAAAAAVKSQAEELKVSRPLVIAVTVLTSIDQQEWEGLNYGADLTEQVVHLAKLAQAAGMDGVVASPQEAAAIRKACGEKFVIVTPGIRPANSEVNDQSRIATPSGAIGSGAHFLVVGRPITAAAQPKLATEKIVKEMEGVV
jgi:orotidine-5'-phosphate decarboxylase